ncbi:MAG: YiiD C-terminal domain-containing protein [Pseudomonadota bacterium]|nr:YiiD C-terminal domain-containing protein [Pseudomonadota bacterium]
MNEDALQNYLDENFPLSRAMGVAAVSAGQDSVLLKAPLEPNINHHDTMFGGSASTICILAAFSLVHVRLHAEGLSGDIIIRRNTMKYEVPVRDEAFARASLANEAEWDSIVSGFKANGIARVAVNADLECGGRRAGRFSGVFAALSSDAIERLSGLKPRT